MASASAAECNQIERILEVNVLERTRMNTEPAEHTVSLVQPELSVFDHDCILTAVVPAGSATGTKSFVSYRAAKSGDADLIQSLTGTSVRTTGDSNTDLYRHLLAEMPLIQFSGKGKCIDDRIFTVRIPEARGNIYNLIPLCPDRRSVLLKSRKKIV